ncbi:hypothetical protein D3C87_578020 [compost metagenome]
MRRVDAACQVGHHRVRENGVERESGPYAAAHAVEHARGQQRVAADIEEIVGARHLRARQQFGPDCLKRRFRGAGRRGAIWLVGFGCRQGGQIERAVGQDGQCGKRDHCPGQQIVRQTLAQLPHQRLRRRAGDHVRDQGAVGAGCRVEHDRSGRDIWQRAQRAFGPARIDIEATPHQPFGLAAKDEPAVIVDPYAHAGANRTRRRGRPVQHDEAAGRRRHPAVPVRNAGAGNHQFTPCAGGRRSVALQD